MDTLIITHNAGFFSCCSKIFSMIIEYVNKYKKLPDIKKQISGKFLNSMNL